MTHSTALTDARRALQVLIFEAHAVNKRMLHECGAGIVDLVATQQAEAAVAAIDADLGSQPLYSTRENAARWLWWKPWIERRVGDLAPYEAQRRASTPAPVSAQGDEVDAWAELCRRVYVELFYCDQQMTSGRKKWQQGPSVRDALRDAKAALDARGAARAQQGGQG